MLTGKLKEKFEQWYFKNYCISSLKYSELMPHHKEDVFGWFYKQKTQMQSGVIIDFLDSIGIELFCQICINLKNGKRDGIDFSICVKNINRYSGWAENRNKSFLRQIELICKAYDNDQL